MTYDSKKLPILPSICYVYMYVYVHYRQEYGRGSVVWCVNPYVAQKPICCKKSTNSLRNPLDCTVKAIVAITATPPPPINGG